MRRIAYLLSLVVLLAANATTLFGAETQIAIVSGKDAPAIEQTAAKELASLLERVCKATITTTTSLPANGDVIVLGSPKTNPAVREIAGDKWPKLSEQGHALKSFELANRKALLVGGGSPVATLWAAYEIGYQHGVRYMLFGDVDPAEPQALRLTGFDLTFEPTQSVRAFRVLDPLVTGTEFWSERDHLRLITQLSKLKFNVLIAAPYSWQPFEKYEFGGVAKTSATSNFGLPLTVAPTDAGRAVFKGAKVFSNPSLEADSDAERISKGIALLSSVFKAARDVGMQTQFEIRAFDVPAEFEKAISGSKREQPHDLQLAITTANSATFFNFARIDALRKTYRDLGVIAIDLGTLNSFEAVPATHAERVRQLPLLKDVASSRWPTFAPLRDFDVPEAFQTQFFGQPTGGGPRSGAGSKWVKQVQARERLVSWQTVLPLIWTERTDALIARGMSAELQGASIELAPFNGLSPELPRLARAAFGAKQTIEESQFELLTPVAGREGAERLAKSYSLIARATQLLRNDPAFAPPLPGLVLKHFADETPAPVWWKDAKDSYLAAMNEFYRGNQRARAADKPFARYGAKKCEFAFQYFNCVEAVKAAGNAHRKGEKDAAIEQLEKAVEALYSGIDALREVARDPHDLGLIAALNEFGYRPLQKQLEALQDAAQ